MENNSSINLKSMRKFLLVGCMYLSMTWGHVVAQERTVTGKVTAAEDNSALPGVNVVLKGTTNGTVTDVQGNYTLTVSGADGTLIFSFIGLVTREVAVADRVSVDVALSQDTRQLGEVIVTAMGIEKSTRTLGYSVGKVGGEDIVQSRAPSLLNSLQGKVAGVQITSSSGAPGASNKVIIRGFTSLNDGNGPLYVVDGIPVNNSFTGNTSLNGASDFGSRINDINPEDIESVTVLKGASATQLYGSRASSGVILITTKTGRDAASRGKKAEVSVASSLVFENVLKLPTFQNERGQGFYGSTSAYLDENTSFGSKFDGQLHPWGQVINNQQRVKRFEALPNNVKEFLETGKVLTNSVALQGGNAVSNYYISYSNVDADGIMPTDADSYKRNTLSIRGATELSNRITSTANLNYARTQSRFVPAGQGQTVWNNVIQTPRDISLLELRDFNNPFNDLEGYYSPYTNNPWRVLENYNSSSVIDRLYGNVELGYKLNESMNFLARVGSDVATTEWEQWQPKEVILGINASRANPGNYQIQTVYNREFNTDIIGNFNRDLSSTVSLSGLVGFNINQRQFKNIQTQINDLVIPGFYNISNSANSPTALTLATLRRLYGLYAQANLGYRDYLFLSLSARNDWSSTLPIDNNSFFYPSASLAFDVTSALGLESNTLSYAKFRAGFAKAGKDADPYRVRSVFVQGEHSDGFINLNAPYAQSIPAFEVSNQIGNPNLQPEITTELEVGAELQFFRNRIGIDITVYDKRTRDNILAVPVPASTGYTTQILNIAEVSNKGIELLLTGTPIMKSAFRWDVALNFARNIPKVIDLGGPERISVGGLSGNRLIARVGGPMFEIEGDVPLRDAQGRVVVDGAGLPRPNPEKQIIGNTNYKFLGGVTNRFNYKGFSLSGTFDIRQGGYLYSRTSTLMYFAGITPATLYNDRQPFIVPNSAVQITNQNDELVFDEFNNPVTQENTTPIYDSNGQLQNFWSSGGFDLDKSFLVSKSFVKLRELIFSYALPKSWLSKTPFGAVDISVIGRNLLLWVPKDNVFIDPEQTTFGTDIESEFGEFGASPTTRSYGFNIRLTL